MSLVFVAAEPREFEGILRHARNIGKLWWKTTFARRAELNGRTIVLVANGPGPKLAADAAGEAKDRLNHIEAFISTGFCGALDSGLRRYDIVVANSVNGQPVHAPRNAPAHTPAPLVSQDRVACSIAEKRNLRASGIAVEMEAGGVMPVARQAGVPFYCVRVVTDAAAEAFALDFNSMRDSAGRFSRARIAAAALRNPIRILPELARLQRTSKSASIALGDFIANCEF